MAALWEAFCTANDQLGFDEAVEGVEQLVLARIIEPTSMADSLRVPGSGPPTADDRSPHNPSWSTSATASRCRHRTGRRPPTPNHPTT
jgi:hypothetical protein